MNDRLRLRLDIADIPKKPVWKIDYYEHDSCAFGAEDASEITHCNYVHSKQIPDYPPALADHWSAAQTVIERNQEAIRVANIEADERRIV